MSVLKDITEIEYLIRQLYKIDSKLDGGKFIAAWRDNRRLISRLENHRKDILDEQDEKE